MKQIPILINPLKMRAGSGPPTETEILSFLVTPGVEPDPVSVAARYQEIDSVEPNLFAPPADDRILGQLIWPLRHAKASYIVGNYLSTIALGGFVAEMATILIFELIERTFNNRSMTENDEKCLFGNSFEGLEQRRRIDILRTYGLPEEVTCALGRIRGTRRRHLHLARQLNREELARDARAIFKDAVYVVAAAIGQNVQDGKLLLTPQMMRYLRRVESEAASAPPTAVRP